MSEIYQNISKIIKELRGDISQEHFSKKLNIAPNKLSRWETGTYKPTAEDLDKIARICNVPISIFFPKHNEDEKIAALTSALGGLNDDDLDEVINYARYRKAKVTLKNENNKKRKKG